MATLENIKFEFNNKKPLYESLREEALFIINRAMSRVDIKINKIESRIKEIESFMGKIDRKESNNAFTDILDILGVRIVCLFLSDIIKIREIINSEFTIISEDNKIDGSNIDTFGYMSVHFIVKLKDQYIGPRYDNIKMLFFEIQVRTMAMDSWANISHYLEYKSENDIPSDLKKDFHALSGLFYVADKHFEMFFKSRELNTEQIIEKFEQTLSHSKEEINIDSLKAYMLIKFPDREHNATSDTISNLIDQLYRSGYKFIDEINLKVDLAWDAFIQYELERPPASTDNKFAHVGVIRVLLEIADKNFRKESGYETTSRNYERYAKFIKVS